MREFANRRNQNVGSSVFLDGIPSEIPKVWKTEDPNLCNNQNTQSPRHSELSEYEKQRTLEFRKPCSLEFTTSVNDVNVAETSLHGPSHNHYHVADAAANDHAQRDRPARWVCWCIRMYFYSRRNVYLSRLDELPRRVGLFRLGRWC